MKDINLGNGWKTILPISSRSSINSVNSICSSGLKPASGNIFYNDLDLSSIGESTYSIDNKYIKEIEKKVVDSLLNKENDSIDLVLNYLRGQLEDIMDNPERLLDNMEEINRLWSENIKLQEQNKELSRRLNLIEDRLGRLELDREYRTPVTSSTKSNIMYGLGSQDGDMDCRF